MNHGAPHTPVFAVEKNSDFHAPLSTADERHYAVPDGTVIAAPAEEGEMDTAVLSGIKIPADAAAKGDGALSEAAPAYPKLIGEHRGIVDARDLIAKYAPSNLPVLITGETGTGKEVIAHCMHRMSRRADRKFIAVNCASLSPTLVESELFGHVQGAFTGALKTKYGFFEAAHGGTLFLDEIGDLPPEIQSKFLRILDNGQFVRIGENTSRSVDVRIISATNQDLDKQVMNNRFRKDLFFRLKGVHIHLPPLRDRRSDISLLIRHFLGRHPSLSPGVLELFSGYHWPGNVRELKMVIQRLKDATRSGTITDEQCFAVMKEATVKSVSSNAPLTYREFKEQIIRYHERNYFQSLIMETAGNISAVARKAGLERRYVYDKLKSLGLMK